MKIIDLGDSAVAFPNAVSNHEIHSQSLCSPPAFTALAILALHGSSSSQALSMAS